MARPWPKTCDDRRPDAWDIGFSARRSGVSKKANPYRGSRIEPFGDLSSDLAYYWSLGWDEGGDWSIELGDELC